MAARIGVVIPAWNLGRELEECVGSILAQGVPVRIIVVDNASDEPLPSLGDVEVVTLPHRVSVGAARNAGLERVDEEYVMFMEGDDILLPGALSFLYELVSGRPKISIAAGSFLVWDPRTNKTAHARWPFDYCYKLNAYPRVFALVNCVRNVLPTTGPVLARTEAVRAAAGFDNSDWAEDWALGVIIAFVGQPILSRRSCGLYRVDPRRVTLSDRKERRFAPAWRGRSAIRRRLGQSAAVPKWVRTLSPLLVIPHLYFTMMDMVAARQRVT